MHDSNSHSPSRPSAGDYVVLYEPRRLNRNPRLVLARWADGASPTLIRATFESAEVAGTRFEDQARAMAAKSGTRSFRGVNMEYTPLDVTTDADGP
jgi:hypothetical protein